MIEKVIVKDVKKLEKTWIREKGLFKNGQEFNFNPGINLIIGPNGSGKSSLLDSMADYLLCERSLYSKIPEQGFLYPQLWDRDENFLDGLEIKADYKIKVFRYRNSTDLSNSDIQSSPEFFRLNFYNIGQSTGDSTVASIGVILDYMFGKLDCNGPIFPIEGLKKRQKSSNDLWKKRIQDLLDYYTANSLPAEKTKNNIYTLILDEPDRNLDIDNIQDLSQVLGKPRPDIQIIAVIHNPALIWKLSKNKDINIIEMEPGYLEKIKNYIEK